MRAILVIDMPKDCCDCPCYYEEAYRCQVHMENDEELYDGKPSWCPLKPMPSKRKSMVEWVDANVKTHDLTEYDKGWNDCVDFLEGSEDD